MAVAYDEPTPLAPAGVVNAVELNGAHGTTIAATTNRNRYFMADVSITI
jgi:hypothetical protein